MPHPRDSPRPGFSPRPGLQGQSEAARKTAQFTTFAEYAIKHLPTAIDPPAIETLLADVTKNLQAIISCERLRRGKSKKERDGLDRKGTELWNMCTRFRRDEISEDQSKRRKLLLRTRTFAFFMIDVARFWKVSNDAEQEHWVLLADVLHLMRLALKAGKVSLDDSTTKFASNIFLKAADYSVLLGKWMTTMLGPDDVAECKRLDCEYYILRTAMCWKEGNLNVAEFMFDKGQPTIQCLDPTSAEKMAEVLLEIGKDFSKKKDFALAARWLERADDIINSQDIDHLPRDAIQLRLAVGQAHVHALLGMQTVEAAKKACDLVSFIRNDLGNVPVVLLLRLELLENGPAEMFDVEEYAGILRQMVEIFNFSESHFKLLIYHARQLHGKFPSKASQMVNGMINSSIVSKGKEEWAERLVLLRIWMEQSQNDNAAAIEELNGVIQGLQQNLTKPFGSSAAVGALTIVWQKIETNYQQGRFDLAASWCLIGLQRIFENGGPANIARLCRKLILCAIHTNDTDGARQIFHEMPKPAQDETMTRYLMYKVALKSKDRNLATECLEHVGMTAAQDPNFLYACVIEAQKTDDKVCASQAMKQLIHKHEFNENTPVHLPALLRSNIRVVIMVMQEEKGPTAKAAVDELVDLFERVFKAAQRDPKDKDGHRLFTVKELDWFCQNSYNLGLKNSEIWNMDQLTRLFGCCLNIMNLYPPDISSDTAVDLRFRKMFCHFLVAVALMSLARTEDNRETQLQHYLNVRKHVATYDNLMQEQLQTADPLMRKDLTAKLATLLVFDYEAAVTLKDYGALGHILRLANECKDVSTFKAMGDIALRGQLPGHNLYAQLGIIINEIWELESMKCDKLAKYTRCMFQAVRLSDPECGQKVIQQAIEVAKGAKETNHPYPREELEWLVTTSFNQAVDAFGAKRDAECQSWAHLAMSLAHYANDGGFLERVCQEKMATLNFDLE
ncbi:hypothetical protein CkaCkLH20_11348 [Colletotrichum karsti]|uniref:Protein ZIP4 homolog n=1 Tax=Colletotrichum karsti TaxID=1095194 RepID=A0A9P6HVL2_9PEZI|nr:uncharacterized protein CkaCkLH20_11348 [Colletotrichum karsti]KAF9871179.1 hypothetical protein CkaCkLH20_11348 [Colletotrichum karsti]